MTSSRRSRANTFAALQIDRAGERREDAAWLSERARTGNVRYLLLRNDGHALVTRDRSGLRHLSAGECAAVVATTGATFLGSTPEVDHFLLALDEATAGRVTAAIDGVFLDLRSAGAMLPAADAGLFAYARGLAHWQQRMRYCHLCAAPLALTAAGHRAVCTNPQCGAEHFPRTDPAVIVLVEHGDACLLGRQAAWPAKRYSTLAGFVEPGETLEDAVRREVYEESGVHVGECDYHSSQPWPFPASIMLGFTAQAESMTIRVGSELEEARWFTPAQLVDSLRSGELLTPMPVSISYRLIEDWLRRTAGVELTTLTRDDPLFATRR